MIKGLVSVVMPVCNNKNYLKQAIDSILNQTYKNFELIVVDGSTDIDSIEILKAYGNKIKYVPRKKNGIADALNYGISLARGEFIARMDADDISHPNRFDVQVTFLNSHNEIDVVGTAVNHIDEEGKIIASNLGGHSDYDKIRATLIFGNIFYHPTIMFRAKLFFEDNYRYALDRHAEDYDLWTQFAVNNIKMTNLTSVLLDYRVHEESLYRTTLDKAMISVSNSAYQYTRKMFHIKTDSYEIVDFYSNGFLCDLKNIDQEYLYRQISLMREIYKNNEIINKNKLIEVLNTRWNRLCGFIITDKSFNIPNEEISDIFFIDYLQKKYCCPEEKLCQTIKKEAKKSFDIRKKLKTKQLAVIIYGAGVYGVVCIKKMLKIKKEGIVSWTLDSVSDKVKKEIKVENLLIKTIAPEDILKRQFDYIFISSNKYFDEIKKELLALGVKEEKILQNQFLLNI